MPDLNAFDFMDSDGDGYRETGVADSDGNGMHDVAAIDGNRDGYVESYVWDSNHDGIFDSVTTDTDLDGVLDSTGVDINQDGMVDAVVDPGAHPVPDVQVTPQVDLYPDYTIVGPSDGGSVVDNVTNLIPDADPYSRVVIDRIVERQNDMIDTWVEPDHHDHDDW